MRRIALSSLILLLSIFGVRAAAGSAPGADEARDTEGPMCTCMSPKRPTCEVWWQTSAIFVGRVTRIDTVTEEDDSGSRIKRLVRMRVQERWRGVQGQRDIVVATGAGGGDCGFQFERDREYLVYANQSSRTGRYETGICSRTAAVDEAAGDLAYLRSLESAPQEVSLYGMVYRERQQLPSGDAVLNPDVRLDPGGPMAGVQVTLAGTTDQHTIVSDEEGWYQIDRLPVGRYELRLSGEEIDASTRWRLRIPIAPACIWRNIIVDPKPIVERQ